MNTNNYMEHVFWFLNTFTFEYIYNASITNFKNKL